MNIERPVREIGQKIYFIRNHRVMLDTDLALLYGVQTFNLNKAVKRNIERFPKDFMFQLTAEEMELLTFQIGMSKKQGRGGRRTLPYFFTQEGVVAARRERLFCLLAFGLTLANQRLCLSHNSAASTAGPRI